VLRRLFFLINYQQRGFAFAGGAGEQNLDKNFVLPTFKWVNPGNHNFQGLEHHNSR
jgi:hypothetical protein